MKRGAIALALACAVGCTTNDGSLQIEAAIPVTKSDTECFLDPGTSEYLVAGYFDPRGLGWEPSAYALNLKVSNTLDAPTSTASSAGNESGNDAEIISFDFCWFPAHPGSDGEPVYSSYDDGIPDKLTCDQLPEAQKSSVLLSAPVPAGGVASVSINLLDRAALQGLYGTGFDPGNIPDIGAGRLSTPGADVWLYSLAAQDPADLSTRDPAWGNFPTTNPARVIVQARANAVLLSGGSIQSNWFVFPVEVCVGCMAAACGVQVMTECTASTTNCGTLACPPAGECSDGSYCIPPNPCPDGAACQPVCGTTPCVSGDWYLEGAYPDLTDACQPYQDKGPACLELEGCP